jgi:hypothetical protein
MPLEGKGSAIMRLSYAAFSDPTLFQDISCCLKILQMRSVGLYALLKSTGISASSAMFDSVAGQLSPRLRHLSFYPLKQVFEQVKTHPDTANLLLVVSMYFPRTYMATSKRILSALIDG